MIAIIVVLLCSAWLGIFSYRNITYSDELWWQFTLYGDAPRFLRATVGTIAVALFFALASLSRSKLPEPALPCKEDLEKAHEIVTKSRKTYANLALLGDKALFF
jgi:phosphatidylglycerol lysyltransferase